VSVGRTEGAAAAVAGGEQPPEAALEANGFLSRGGSILDEEAGGCGGGDEEPAGEQGAVAEEVLIILIDANISASSRCCLDARAASAVALERTAGSRPPQAPCEERQETLRALLICGGATGGARWRLLSRVSSPLFVAASPRSLANLLLAAATAGVHPLSLSAPSSVRSLKPEGGRDRKAASAVSLDGGGGARAAAVPKRCCSIEFRPPTLLNLRFEVPFAAAAVPAAPAAPAVPAVAGRMKRRIEAAALVSAT